jgi:hypothetical protein
MYHRLLVEALLSSFNMLPELDDHVRFVGEIMDPVVMEWASDEIRAMLTSEGIVATGGLTNPDAPQDQKMRLTLLTTALNVMVRTTEPRGEGDVSRARITPSGLGGCAKGGDGFLHPCAGQTRALIPNFLALARALHELWSPAGVALLGNFQVLLDMRRSDFSALLSGSGPAVSRLMSPEDLWVDRNQLWLTNLRECSYIVMGEAAHEGVLFEDADVLAALSETYFFGIAYIQKRHLRSLLRHVVLPLVRYCPREGERLDAVMAVLGGFYSSCLEYLSREWDAAGQRAHQPMLNVPTADGGAMTAEQREIVEDKLLVDVTQELIQHIAHILADIAVQTSQDGSGRAPHLHELGVIGLRVLTHEATVAPVMGLLCSALTWPSSKPALASAMLLASLMPTMLTNPAFLDLIAQRILPSTLQGLSCHGQHGECEVAMITIVCHAAEGTLQHPDVQRLLASVPGATQESFMQLVDQITGNPRNPVALKTKRKYFKAFLKDLVGVNVGQVWGAIPFLFVTRTLTLTLAHIHSLAHTHTRTHALTRTPTYTHTPTHTHTHSHSLTHSLTHTGLEGRREDC